MGAAKRNDRLSRGEIARAALVMADRDGVDKFSMRRLAQELDVTTMAVYYHFENKAEILQAAADQVWIEVITEMQPVDDPIESIVQRLLTTRRVFERHTDLTPYAFASPTTEDAVHVIALGISEEFERAGFHGEDAADAYFATATYTLGSGLLFAERSILDRRIRRPVSDLASDLAPDATAEGGESYHAIRRAMGDDPDLTRFERGLRTLMDALVSRYLSPTTR